MGENHFERIPVVFYGSVLLMAAIAFKILENVILKTDPYPESLTPPNGIVGSASPNV